MRKYLFVTLSLLLMVSCHHRDRKEKHEDVIPASKISVPTDTLPRTAVDSAVRSVPSVTSEIRQLKQDSAEITNLRLLSRKQRVIYNPSLLTGEWLRGTEHEVFKEDHTGLLWDTSDDVVRNEAIPFSWKLDSNLLLLVFRLERGALVPKNYVVTFADEENLSYSDVYGNAFLWDKQASDTIR